MCKPGGRILLLQHGKGTWDFVNGILDSGAGERGSCLAGLWSLGAALLLLLLLHPLLANWQPRGKAAPPRCPPRSA